MANLTLVVVAKDHADMLAFVHANEEMAGIDMVPVVNKSGASLASIGNRFANMESTGQVLGLCHADCTFAGGALEEFEKIAAGRAVCGIVGVDRDGIYRWSKNGQELIVHPGGMRESGPGWVSTLDSCCVFFRRDLGLRFDEREFDGFHCHVEDLCLQAHAKGIPVIVPPAQASHVGKSTFDQKWREQYWIYRARLARKWSGTDFRTT